VLDKRRADELADQLDLDEIPACPMCLFDLAWEIHEERMRPGTLTRTVNWVWPEIEEAVEAVVLQARMREVMYAEDALNDLVERGVRSRLVRVVVERLARAMADDFTSR
jgi:hypothetical protein